MSSYNNSINSIRFKWKIQDFHRVASINKCGVLISEEFNYNRFKNLSFHLEFCPINLDSRTHSSLYIRSKNVTKDIRQQLNCNFWVENSNGDWLAPCEGKLLKNNLCFSLKIYFTFRHFELLKISTQFIFTVIYTKSFNKTPFIFIAF